MHTAAAAAVVLTLVLAPEDGSHELRYRFEKDMTYEETTERSFSMEGENKEAHWDVSSTERLRRTILEVDDARHPTAERVEVLEFKRDVKASPEEPVGVVADPAEGRTFVWRRLEERWGLFDRNGEVTARHGKLVERLKNWRDARLPRKAVAVGERWEIDARTYLETAGYAVPRDVQGVARFRLEEVDASGVARISFLFEARHGVERWKQEGTWRFDVARGRDLELELEGTVEVEHELRGSGRVSMRRVVRYR